MKNRTRWVIPYSPPVNCLAKEGPLIRTCIIPMTIVIWVSSCAGDGVSIWNLKFVNVNRVFWILNFNLNLTNLDLGSVEHCRVRSQISVLFFQPCIREENGRLCRTQGGTSPNCFVHCSVLYILYLACRGPSEFYLNQTSKYFQHGQRGWMALPDQSLLDKVWK